MQTDAIKPGFQGLVQAMRVQIRIIGALMLREAMTHYGRESLGFFWLIAEPMILTLGVMVMWTITGQAHGHGIGVIPFALTGYALLTIFRHVVGHSTHIFRNGSSLLFHQNIHLLDIFIARHVLTMTGTGLAFFITYVPFYLLDYVAPFHDTLLLSAGIVMMTWYAASVGLLIACLTELYEPVERFVQPIMYITLPFSGAFYMVDWLPEKAQFLVLLSPQVNITEMFRDGMFGNIVDTYWSLWYSIGSCLLFTTIGLTLLKRVRYAVRIE